MPTSHDAESSNVIGNIEAADLDVVLQNPNGAHGRDKRGELITSPDCSPSLTFKFVTEFLLLPFLWIPPFSTRPATELEVKMALEATTKKRN